MLTINLLVLVGVLAFYIRQSSAGSDQQANSFFVNTANSSNQVNPLDQLSSADVAVQVAKMTNVPEANAVANTAQSEDALLNVVASDNQLISKPQVVLTNVKTRQDIVKYVTKPGDTVSALAIKYGVTSESIEQSNSLSSNDLPTGITIYIPPVNGLIYTVKQGDTPQSLAQEFNANANEIISFNDAEISGLVPGEMIVIPNGTKQVYAPSYDSYGAISAVYGYNGYDFGNCTWYVANRRAEVGEPIPANLGNASTWYYIAQQEGLPTGSTPQVHAVLWFGYYADHVAFVESVNPDGSIVISEMNRDGFDVVDTRTMSAAEAASYKYIY